MGVRHDHGHEGIGKCRILNGEFGASGLGIVQFGIAAQILGRGGVPGLDGMPDRRQGIALFAVVVIAQDFRAALAPVLAARREGKTVKLAAVIAHVRAVARQFEAVVVEGAGGLLSPLGEDFDSRDLLARLKAVPLIVLPNRLGAVNQARLVWEALPNGARKIARIVLMEQRVKDASARSNGALLQVFVPAARIIQLPWMEPLAGAKCSRAVAAALGELLTAPRA